MKIPVIEIHDLWFYFNGDPVLKDVNFTVHERGFVALIGPNGGGKTTLIKIMLGLLKPKRGSVRVMGHKPHEVIRRIGYVPQEIGININFPVSVFDLVLMGRLRHTGAWSRFSKEDRMAAQKALERARMLEYRNRRIKELSGGQRQRVFVARALVDDPKILLLDEPFTNVDRDGQSDFYKLLKELNEIVTIILVSHDLNVISSYVKSVACINQQLIFHDAAEITGEMLEMAYHCPVDLIAHGLPHRVFRPHEER